MKKNVWRDTKVGGYALIAAICVVWEISYRTKMIALMSWPSLVDVAGTFLQLILDGEILSNVASSLERLAIGYVIAVILAVVVGLLMGYSTSIFNLLEPLTEILRPIPSPAYIPVVILFLGIDNEMKIFMIVFASFFPILLNTYSGVRAVDPVQVNTARTFGLNSRKIVQQIIIPAALPFIVTGMRVSLAISLILVVISEMVASNNGIGFFILNAQRSFRVKEMYAGIIALAIIGYSLNSIFLAVERRVMAWHIGATKKEAV